MKLSLALAMFPGLLIGLTVHEFAHAWSASLLGDGFARRQGRVSLNPLRHLSPLGTLAIFFLPFGWGRPVPINLYNFRHPRWNCLVSSLAGPAANLVVVALVLGGMQLTRRTFLFGAAGGLAMMLAHLILVAALIINTMLAALNLLPIPPLDGSKIWPCIVPWMKPAKATTNLLWLIVLVVLLSTGSLSFVSTFAVERIMGLAPAADGARLLECHAGGSGALNRKQWAEAELLFSDGLAIYPASHQCLYGRAVARGGQAKWSAALDDIDAAIDLKPDPAYRLYRSTVLRGLGRKREAPDDSP
jgi:Zn-dependent protease